MDFSESELYSIIKSQQIAIDSLKQQIRQLKNDIKIEENDNITIYKYNKDIDLKYIDKGEDK